MANYGRSDGSGSSTGQQPIMLARLPYVGAAQPISASAPAAQAAPLPEIPLPEPMPQLDLRSEIELRTRLHIASTPDVDQGSTASHFADRGHAAEHGPTIHQPAPATRRQVTSQQDSSKQQTTIIIKPTTFSEKLFQLHAQLAPHAGLIVALALIASAGLLYWMIVGPVQAPMPIGFESYSENENYGVEVQDEGFESGSNYMPEFAVDAPLPAEIESVPDLWTEVPLPSSQPAESAPPSLQILPATDELSYPTTSKPNDLNFSKIMDRPSASDSLSTPEVARRSTTTTNR